MKTKIYKILGVALTLVLAFSLGFGFVPTNKVEAEAYTPNQWNSLSTPSSLLKSGSDITDFAVAADGSTIYLINATDGFVYRSTNGGASFTQLTDISNGRLVAVAPDDPNALAVVDSANVVWLSNNGGASWANLGAPAGDDEEISDIAVSPARSGTLLGRDYVVSTYSESGWGDIYVVGSTANWSAVASSAGLTTYDFTSVALVPNWVGERVVLAVGSDAVAGGNPEQSAAAAGDSWLVAINAATGALAGPQKVRLDAAGSDSPAATGFASLGTWGTGETASWDATTAAAGSYSVKLDSAGEYVEFIPAPGVTFADLADIISGWSFLFNKASGDTNNGPGLELRFTGPEFDPTLSGPPSHVDITVNTAETVTGTGAWVLEDVTSTSTAICYGNDANGDAFSDGSWGGTSTGNLTLAELVTAVTTLATDANWNGSDPADWTLTRVRAETYGATVNIDDVTINGTTYYLENGAVAQAGEIFSSSIALPSDFDAGANFRAYVGWTSEKSGDIILCSDDVYRVDSSSVRKLEVRPTVCINSLSYFGTVDTGTLMAGETDSTKVWTSTDPTTGMPTWSGSAKSPSGADNTIVHMLSDTEAFAVTSSPNGGFHKSEDTGRSWNGLSFIDGEISTIDDVMPSPDGSTVFLATNETDVGCSLWRGVGFPSPGSWQRVGFYSFAGSSIVRLSPDYDTDSTVYWFDDSSTTIKRSTNAGQTWATRTGKAAPTDAAVESQDVLYIISGANVYKSTNGAWFFGGGVNAGKGTLSSIAMVPSYPAKPIAGNVLVGGDSGVALSKDSAATFSSLKSPTDDPVVSVLADEDFATNNIVYATDGTGIWRFTVGTSSAWEQIDATATIVGLAQCDGVLYGAYTVDSTSSAARRALSPTGSVPVTFESMTAGITGTFTAVRVSGTSTENVLWSIAGMELYGYEDQMAKAKTEVTVPETVAFDSVSGGNAQFVISWTSVSNALRWEVNIYLDPACRSKVWMAPTTTTTTEGTTTTIYYRGTTVVVPAGTLVGRQDYFVKTRAREASNGEDISSPWSSVHRFSVAAGEKVTVSYLGVQPLGPEPGAIDVPLSPGFTWSTYASSTRYEFQLASDAAFTNILAEAKVSTTGYKYDGKLDYATTYFWRVRGIEPSTSDWSPVASFTTEKAPPPPPPPPPSLPEAAPPVVTPTVVWAIIAIGAILVIAVIVLIVRTRRTV